MLFRSLVEHTDEEDAPDFEVRLSRWVPAPPAEGSEDASEGDAAPITIREMLGLGPAEEPKK